MVPKRLSPEHWHEVAVKIGYLSELDRLTYLSPFFTTRGMAAHIGCKVAHLRKRLKDTGAPWPAKQYKDRECPECLTPFPPKSASQKACSPECKEIRDKRWKANYQKRHVKVYKQSQRENLVAARKPKIREGKEVCRFCPQELNSLNHSGICGACDVRINGIQFVSKEVSEVRIIAR